MMALAPHHLHPNVVPSSFCLFLLLFVTASYSFSLLLPLFTRATYQLQHWWDGQTDWSTGLTFSDQPRTPEFFTEMIKVGRPELP